MFIIGKYVKEVTVQKIKHITKIEQKNTFCLHFWFHFLFLMQRLIYTI